MSSDVAGKIEAAWNDRSTKDDGSPYSEGFLDGLAEAHRIALGGDRA